MDQPVNLIDKLNLDNQALRREIKRLKLVNELNIVLFEESQQKQINQVQMPSLSQVLNKPNLQVAMNDS